MLVSHRSLEANGLQKLGAYNWRYYVDSLRVKISKNCLNDRKSALQTTTLRSVMQHVSCRGYIGKTVNSQAEGDRFESGRWRTNFSNFQGQIFFSNFLLILKHRIEFCGGGGQNDSRFTAPDSSCAPLYMAQAMHAISRHC